MKIILIYIVVTTILIYGFITVAMLYGTQPAIIKHNSQLQMAIDSLK